MKRVLGAAPSAASMSDAVGVGISGAFRVGEREVMFTETGRAGCAGW